MKQSAIPSHIFKEAEEHNLGTPLKVYRNMLPLICGCQCLVYPLLFGLTALMNYLYYPEFSADPRWLPLLLLCGICITGAVISFRAAILERNRRLYLCDDGLLFRDGSYVETIRWDEVKEIKLIGNAYTGQALLLLARDASPFRTSHSSWGFTYVNKVYWNAIEDALLPYLLPRALERWERGEEIVFDASRFGVITLDKQQIKYEGRVSKLSEIEDARANGGRLWLKLNGMWKRSRGHVANARLCAALIRRCITLS
jgi:hypothetical protein